MPGPSSTARNIVANYAGQLISAVLGLVSVPLYLHFMGIEAYGLVGISLSLQSICLMFDFGFGITFLREVAKLRAADDFHEIRRVFRAFEAIYLLLSVLICVVIVLAAPFLVTHWIHSQGLPRDVVVNAIRLMGLGIAVYWPFGIYSNGLMGFQQVVRLNVIVVGCNVFRVVGSIAILWLMPRDIEAFFIFQVLSNLLQTLASRLYFTRNVPPRGRYRVELRSIRHLLGFASALGASTIVAVILSQLDKISLSGAVSLETFGYYAIASSAAAALSRLFAPVSNALFPRLTEVKEVAGIDTIVSVFHLSCQLMTVMAVPAALTMALFAQPFLLAWTGNAATAQNAFAYLSILALATGANGLMYMQYNIQWIYGASNFTLRVYVISAIVFGPAFFILVPKFGGVAAAGLWLGMNLAYFFVSVPVAFRNILRKAGWPKNTLWDFFLKDFAVPSLAAIAVLLMARAVIPDSLPRILSIFSILAAGGTSLVFAAVAAPRVREYLLRSIRLRAPS